MSVMHRPPAPLLATSPAAGRPAVSPQRLHHLAYVTGDLVTIYDRIDYLRVTPESALAAYGDAQRQRGYEQFDAVGVHRGPDNRLHTPDDVDLNPVDVDWSMALFYSADKAGLDALGSLSQNGLFTPAAKSAENNYDLWIIATAKAEKEQDGEPMVGKASLVLTVPTYTLNGRRYIRDLDRWIDDGPAKENQ